VVGVQRDADAHGAALGVKPRSTGHTPEMADKNDSDKNDTNDALDPPPGPTDQGREGGMATREVAPELVKKSGESKG
jgi:hypothetical protein